jgi:hypothetical protein
MDPKLASALEGLRDIHLPPPISIWPPAAGWWALAGCIVLAAAAIAWGVRRRRASLRRLALRELSALEGRFRAQADSVELAVSLTTLLRRVALARRISAEAAVLHGEPWIALLTNGSRRRACSPQIARDLIQSAYRGKPADGGDPRDWIAFADAWIREVA